jgi:hypothetical protein
MSRTATAGQDKAARNEGSGGVGYSDPRFVPPLTPNTIDFSSKHGGSGFQVKCSARCTGVNGIFNSMPIMLSLHSKDNRVVTIEDNLKLLPGINPTKSHELVTHEFWRAPLLFSNPSGQTRRDFVENQLRAAAEEAVTLATEPRADLAKELKERLQNYVTQISQRLALEIKLLNDPLAKKILTIEQ